MSILVIASSKHLERTMRAVALELDRAALCMDAVAAIAHVKSKIPSLIVVEDAAITRQQLAALRRQPVTIVRVGAFEALSNNHNLDIAVSMVRNNFSALLVANPGPT